MKKILFVLLVLTMSTTAFAQSSWGIKAGAGLSNVSLHIKDLSAGAMLGHRVGYYVGATNNIRLSNHFDLQTELLYASEGTKFSMGSSLGLSADKQSASISMGNLKLPVMIKLKTSSRFNVMVGPYLSYRVALGVKSSLSLPDPNFPDLNGMAKELLNANLKKFDAGFTFGAEYVFKNNLFVDLRYNVGLINILKNDLDLSHLGFPGTIPVKDMLGVEPRIRNCALQFGIGYRF